MSYQKKIYSDILEITKKQAEYIAQEDVKKFDRLTKKRQKLIDELILNQYRIDKNSKECNIIRDEIIELHEKNIIAYQAIATNLQKELRKLRKKKQFNNVYHRAYNSAYEEGIFFDKRNG